MRANHIASRLAVGLLIAVGIAACQEPPTCTRVDGLGTRPLPAGDPEWFGIVIATVEGREPPARCPEVRDAYFKWMRGHYADSVIGHADVEEILGCGCGAGTFLVRLRWNWRLPSLSEGEDRQDVILVNGGDSSGYFEVWPQSIKVSSSNACEGDGGVPLIDPSTYQIALPLAFDTVDLAPAWGINSEDDLRAVIGSERPTRLAPGFTYDHLCSAQGSGTSPPDFFLDPVNVVVP